MELIRLRSENMYSFPVLDLDFRDYATGTTIILGKNLDMDSANGAGKTTILKVLYYALWGKELENVAFSEVVNLKNKNKGFAVELLFKDGDDECKIIRSYGCKLDTKLIKTYDGESPKNSTIEFLMNGEPFEVEADNKLLKKVIEDKLGISPKIFLNSVLTAQKRKKNFLESPDSDKKDDLSDILDLGFYDKAKKLVDEDLAFQEERLVKNKHKLDLATHSIEDLKKSIENLLESSRQYKTNKKEKLSNLKITKEELESKIKELEPIIAKSKDSESSKEEDLLKKEIKEKSETVQVLESDISKEGKLIGLKSQQDNIIEQSKKNIKNLEKRNLEIEKKSSVYQTNISNLEKNVIEVSDKDIDSLQKEIAEEEVKVQKMKAQKEDLSKKKNEFDSLKKDLEIVENNLKESDIILKKLKEENKCFTCERPFEENDENSAQQKLINKKEDELKDYKSKRETITLNLDVISKRITTLEAELKDFNTLEESLKAKEIKINKLNIEKEKQKSLNEKIIFFKNELKSFSEEVSKNLQSIENDKEKEKEALQKIKEITPYFEKLEKIKERHILLKNELSSLQEKLNNLILSKSEEKVNLERHEASLKDLEKTNKSIDELKEEKDPYRKMINENQEKIKNYTKEKEEINSLINKNEEEIKYLKFWMKGFSKSGIKSFETEEVINYLNERVQYHLDVLSEGVQSLIFEPEKTAKTTGSVSNNIHTRSFLNGEERPIPSLSGGERQRLILATDLALSDVAEQKSNSAFNIKFLDEPFDGIDSNGQIKALALFNNLSEERKGFFIISHDKEMQSFCDNAIYILKENEVSRLVDRNTFLNASK